MTAADEHYVHCKAGSRFWLYSECSAADTAQRGVTTEAKSDGGARTCATSACDTPDSWGMGELGVQFD